jgi:hypothetical protein
MYHMVEEDDPILEKAIRLVFVYSIFCYIYKFTLCSIDVSKIYLNTMYKMLFCVLQDWVSWEKPYTNNSQKETKRN